jgi:CheY-like chemotaxis protein
MKKILIADSDETSITLLLGILGKEDYDISVVLDANEISEALEEEIPDIILLEIMLREKNGIDICRRLKSDIRYRDIPVVILNSTGSLFSEAIRDAGADAVIDKPITSLQLLGTIRGLI